MKFTCLCRAAVCLLIRCQVSRAFVEALWENTPFPAEYCIGAVRSILVENFEQNMTKSKSKSKKSDKGKESNNSSNASDNRVSKMCEILLERRRNRAV